MPQTLNLSIKGLHTYSSELSGVPAGALSVADDVNISRANIVEPRRGFDFLGYDPAGIVKKIIFYNGELFVHYNTTLAIFNAGFSSRGTLTTPSNATSVKTASMNDNLYLTNSNGIYKVDDTAANLYAAGIPKGTLIEGNGALVAAGSAIVTTAPNVAYRYVLFRRDANGNTVTGGVSGRYVVNSGGAADYNVPLKVFLPSGLDTTYSVGLYRTAGTSGIPSDEMQLCYETPIASGDITNGYVTLTDITPDALLGASLYTSPSQEGVINDNAQPPLARDIAEYKGHLFFADVVSKHRYQFTLIACGGTNGLALNDTITITRGATSEVYTAKASASVGSKEFALSTASTPAINIDTTARSLVSVINQASSLVYAYLLSTGDGDLPGKILLEERTYGNAAFTVVSGKATAWSPQLTSPAGDNQTSANDEFKNGLMFSKQGIPESVPLKNIFRIGSSDDRIKRIVALRDGLFIFKEKDGVYVLRGENESSFTVSLLDSTAKLVSADSLAPVNNLIYGLFESGVSEVSDSGVTIVGLPIKDKILQLFGTAQTQVDDYAFGVGYDTEGKYILALPESDLSASATQQLVYDVYGRTWCRWTVDMRSAAVSPDNNKLYYGAGDTAKVRVERKTFDYSDYADYGATCTISSYSGTTLFIDNTSGMSVGDILVQGSALGYIESIDLNAGSVVIDNEQTWTTGAATVEHLKAIYCRVEWNPEFAGNPSGFKQFYEASLLFKQGFQKEALVYFFSDANPGESSITLTSSFGNGAWGEFSWGDEAWGGETVKEPVRLGIPRTASRCNQLSVRFESRIAYSDFQLNGISLTFNPTSTRTAR